MKLQVREIQAKSILTPQTAGSLANAYDFSLNPYAGCAFSCSYCYVPKFPSREHEASEWGSWVNVKINAPELVRANRLKIFGKRIFFSSATDPYQYLELKYRLSRRCLQELKFYQPAKITMHTRSHLILQDLELLKSFGSIVQVGVSIPTDREDVRAEFEPKAPSIARRIELIKKLRQEGIAVFASIAPLLPCNPERLISSLADQVDKIWIDEMHWQEVNNRPYLLDKYADFFAPETYKRTVDQVRKQWQESKNSRC